MTDPCEYAALVFNTRHEQHGDLPSLNKNIHYPYTADAIFNCSSTGELWPVMELAHLAARLVADGKVKLPTVKDV